MHFSAGKSEKRAHISDEEESLFKGRLEPLQTPRDETDGNELQLILDNVQHVIPANFQGLIKPFIVSIEDIAIIREPKIRNLRIVSKNH